MSHPFGNRALAASRRLAGQLDVVSICERLLQMTQRFWRQSLNFIVSCDALA
jgi:hypothetical protein